VFGGQRRIINQLALKKHPQLAQTLKKSSGWRKFKERCCVCRGEREGQSTISLFLKGKNSDAEREGGGREIQIECESVIHPSD